MFDENKMFYNGSPKRISAWIVPAWKEYYKALVILSAGSTVNAFLHTSV